MPHKMALIAPTIGDAVESADGTGQAALEDWVGRFDSRENAVAVVDYPGAQRPDRRRVGAA